MSFAEPCRLDASYNFVPKELREGDRYGIYEIGTVSKTEQFMPRLIGYALPGDATLAAKFRFHGIPHAGSKNYIDEYFDVDARRVQLYFRWLICDKPLCLVAQLLGRYGSGVGGRYVWNKKEESEQFWRQHYGKCEACSNPTQLDDCIVRLDALLQNSVPDRHGLYTIATLDDDGIFRTRYVGCCVANYEDEKPKTLRSLFLQHADGKGIAFLEDFVEPSDVRKYYFVWKISDVAVCEMSRHITTANCGDSTKFPWNSKIDFLDAERHTRTCKQCSDVVGDADKGGCSIS